jgi:hypothetical protein
MTVFREATIPEVQSITQTSPSVTISGPSVPRLDKEQLDVLVLVFSTLKQWKLERG